MKTNLCLQSSAALCALLLAAPQNALSADPPRPAATVQVSRPGFFARLFGRSSTNASRVKANPADGRLVVMQMNQPSQVSMEVSATRYEQLPMNSSTEPMRPWGGDPTTSSDNAILRAAFSPNSKLAQTSYAPTDSQASNSQPEPTVQTETSSAPAKVFPTATFLSYGRVKLPFAPYTTLDVDGLPSGSLAKDPVSGQIFRVP